MAKTHNDLLCMYFDAWDFDKEDDFKALITDDYNLILPFPFWPKEGIVGIKAFQFGHEKVPGVFHQTTQVRVVTGDDGVDTVHFRLAAWNKNTCSIIAHLDGVSKVVKGADGNLKVKSATYSMISAPKD